MTTFGTGVTGPDQQELATLPPTVDLSAIGIFNIAAEKYGASPSLSGAANLAAIQAAWNDLFTNGGGKIMVPNLGAAYTIAGTLNAPDVPTEFIGVGKPIFSKADATTFLNFANLNNSLGTRLAGFKVIYTAGSGVAIHIVASQNIHGREIYFGNCSAIYADNNSLQCGLEDFTTQNDTQNGIIICSLNGSQDYLRGGVLRQHGISAGGPTGCTGIYIGSASTAYIDHNHASDFETGMQIGSNAQDIFGVGNRIDSYTNVLIIRNDGGGQKINRIRLTDLIGRLTNSSPNVTSGCIIDTASGTIDDVELKGAGFAGFGRYGIEVLGSPVNVKLLGGISRGNTIAGIGVLGAGAVVHAIGHDCLGAAEGVSAAQQWGFDVENGTLLAIGCTLSGNLTAPTKVVSPGVATLLACPPVN